MFQICYNRRMKKSPASPRKIPLSAAQKAKRYRAKRALDKDRLALYNTARRVRRITSKSQYAVDVRVMSWAVTYLSVR